MRALLLYTKFKITFFSFVAISDNEWRLMISYDFAAAQAKSFFINTKKKNENLNQFWMKAASAKKLWLVIKTANFQRSSFKKLPLCWLGF